MKFVFTSSLFLFLVSCSTINSGRYVKLRSTHDLQEVADQYGVTVGDIRNYNSNIRDNSWIFVPFKAGVMNNKIYKQMRLYSKGDFLWPLPGHQKISSYYGRRGRGHHKGLDISAPRGTKILAAREGKVIFSGWMKGYGRVVIIKHGERFHTVYAHNSSNLVSKGEFVQKGQKIARVGSTGRSTGNHLHFEVRIGKKTVDPLFYFERTLIADR